MRALVRRSIVGLAPDRIRSKVEETTPAGVRTNIVIVIGATTYQSDAASPGKFTKYPTRDVHFIRTFTDPVINAKAVTRDGDTYRFTASFGPGLSSAPVEAHLQGGYLKDLTLPFLDEGGTPAGNETLTFTQINQGPPVDPPPNVAVESGAAPETRPTVAPSVNGTPQTTG